MEYAAHKRHQPRDGLQQHSRNDAIRLPATAGCRRCIEYRSSQPPWPAKKPALIFSKNKKSQKW